ncbi:MAG: hypothetical protein QMD46_09165 [Methanomicrobiales archaeon]|nr:hypothetical protein [Methanomicrobiales archaeon]
MAALFVPGISPLEAILRAAPICLVLLFLFRAIGRHEFADLSPFQLILPLIISESVSDALSAGDTSLATTLISAPLFEPPRTGRIVRRRSPGLLRPQLWQRGESIIMPEIHGRRCLRVTKNRNKFCMLQ